MTKKELATRDELKLLAETVGAHVAREIEKGLGPLRAEIKSLQVRVTALDGQKVFRTKLRVV